VNDSYRMLRALVNWCREEGLLNDDPLKNVKAPRVPNDQLQPLSPEQCQALLNAARETKEVERNRAIVFILLETVLRLSEACSLTVGDASRENGEITVTGKGGNRWRVYLSSRNARRALRLYLDRHRADAKASDSMFVSERCGERRDP
jgi:integrase/recombinase XerD